VPALWEIHKVHHSTEVLTPVSAYRFHPFEIIAAGASKSFFVGVVAGIFGYLEMDRKVASDVLVIGLIQLSVLEAAFNIFSNLRHSHVWLSFGPRLERHFISPAQHQIHHSAEPRHFDKNFGLVFALWDRMFGTLYVPAGRETFRLGIYGVDVSTYHSIWAMYTLPIVNNVKLGRSAIEKLLGKYGDRKRHRTEQTHS
jgi:sterol desaturase/sphingolipid hydroxylase (fatty acid hydroxylase superfamily)